MIEFKSHEESGKFVVDLANEVEKIIAARTIDLNPYQRPLIIGRVVSYLAAKLFRMQINFVWDKEKELESQELNIPEEQKGE